MLLADTDRRIRLLGRAAACFVDQRDPTKVEHGVGDLIARRGPGCARVRGPTTTSCGKTPPLTTVIGKREPRGSSRREPDRGCALAASRTLNRPSLSTPEEAATSASTSTRRRQTRFSWTSSSKRTRRPRRRSSSSTSTPPTIMKRNSDRAAVVTDQLYHGSRETVAARLGMSPIRSHPAHLGVYAFRARPLLFPGLQVARGLPRPVSPLGSGIDQSKESGAGSVEASRRSP